MVYLVYFCLNLLNVVNEEVLAWTKTPGGGGRGRLYVMVLRHHQDDSCIKVAVMKAILTLILWGTKAQNSSHKLQLLKREESYNGIKTRSCLPAWHLTTRPNRLIIMVVDMCESAFVYLAHVPGAKYSCTCCCRSNDLPSGSGKGQELLSCLVSLLLSLLAVSLCLFAVVCCSVHLQYWCC